MTTQTELLRNALERIAEWDECDARFRMDHGSNGERDYYRQIARTALAQPEQPVPQGLRLVGLFSFDADEEDPSLCFFQGTDFDGKDRHPKELCRLLEEETTCGPQKALYAYASPTPPQAEHQGCDKSKCGSRSACDIVGCHGACTAAPQAEQAEAVKPVPLAQQIKESILLPHLVPGRVAAKPEPVGINGLTEAETSATASVMGLVKPETEREEVTDAMVDAYLTAQRRTVEEADRFGRPNIGGLHTNTVREACRNGIRAALISADSKDAGEPVAWVRRHPDGALTAEFLEDAVIEPVRKKSGAWVPLYIRPQAAELAALKADIAKQATEIEALKDQLASIRKWATGWSEVPYDDPWKFAAQELLSSMDMHAAMQTKEAS